MFCNWRGWASKTESMASSRVRTRLDGCAKNSETESSLSCQVFAPPAPTPAIRNVSRRRERRLTPARITSSSAGPLRLQPIRVPRSKKLSQSSRTSRGPMFDKLHVFDDLEARDAALNMGIDEALLERGTGPSLRFYRWERPALSFGYFGRYAEVANEAPQRDVVRRWTGGGIVPHGDDL